MRPWCLVGLFSMAATSALAAEPVADPAAKTVVSFDTMYGVKGSFLATGIRLRGVQGDVMPWTIRSATGSLTSDGHLTIDVRGLVIEDGDAVPAELRGKNDDPFFRGMVSCLVEVNEGRVRSANLMTPRFAADERGNAMIDAMLVLPRECIAPIVMVVAGYDMTSYAISGAMLD